MKYLGIDYGTKRVGLSLSDAEFPLATAYATIASGAAGEEELAKIIVKEEVGVAVIGLPRSLSGAENDIAREIRKFGERLAAKGTVKVEYLDERMSSKEAEKAVGTRDRAKIDAEAARIILQCYLDKINE